MYKQILRPILFLFNPEFVHNTVAKLFLVPLFRALISFIYNFENQKLERMVFGIRFKNPVGLAAGFDKNAELPEGVAACGFGFIEIGTVTPLAQQGNPKPRLFRLREDEALINRMGFNNAGADDILRRLQNQKQSIVIGGNIGKNKETANELAHRDYSVCFETLFEVVDYFVVNVSSPNTPGLRELQEKDQLKEILNRLQKLNSSKSKRKPILLKIAPDLTDSQLDDIIDIVKQTEIDGIVATNTTISRDGLTATASAVEKIGPGGLSGKPLRQRATEVIRYIHTKSQGSITIIGAGGIHTPEDALEKIKAGASLIQLYTGFVYEGPDLVKKIKRELLNF
jgi:dihydroorotate dehydrogenase